MSSALAIAGVTAVLRDLLNDGLINHNVSGVLGSTVTVSALPPDRVVAANGTENTQLNLFLHQVSPNLGWRNEGLPSRDSSGRTRLSNPPLALDLHYLLSAYGAEDLHAEILLGYAMQLLHETPVLGRSDHHRAESFPRGRHDVSAGAARAGQLWTRRPIRADQNHAGIFEYGRNVQAVDRGAVPLPPHRGVSRDRGVDRIVCSARATLPVLSRGPVDAASGRDRGVVVQPSLFPPFPTIESVVQSLEPAATVGATVNITGHHLDGASR